MTDLTDEQIDDICWTEMDRRLLSFARAVIAADRAQRVSDEFDAVAIRYAHKLALDLECVLSGNPDRWFDTAMQTIGDYRAAMNAIHERESPTFMGEPLILDTPERTPLDYCTDPDNCRRCKTQPECRGDMDHAGIGEKP